MNTDIFMGLKSFEFYYFLGWIALGIAIFLVLFYFKSPYKEVKQMKKAFFGLILFTPGCSIVRDFLLRLAARNPFFHVNLLRKDIQF